tara:strand:- start:595 stop:831 length:237 start_codon:yes stop_codon:yes gene_type:complete
MARINTHTNRRYTVHTENHASPRTFAIKLAEIRKLYELTFNKPMPADIPYHDNALEIQNHVGGQNALYQLLVNLRRHK